MNYESFCKDLLDPIPDYRKLVLLLFRSRNDKDLLKECGFLKTDVQRLSVKFKNSLMEENEEYLD